MEEAALNVYERLDDARLSFTGDGALTSSRRGWHLETAVPEIVDAFDGVAGSTRQQT